MGDRSITGAAAGVLCVILFSLIAAVLISSRSGRPLVQYAAMLELVGLCVASLCAVVGLSWYDPIGQILAFIATVISSCEFTILLAQSVRASRRSGRPVFAVVCLFLSVQTGSVESVTWWSYVIRPVTTAASFVATFIYSIPTRAFSAVLGTPAYIYSSICLYGPGLVMYGVPTFGVVLFLSAAWSNFDFSSKTYSAYPIYGERLRGATIPKSNAGSDAVHEIAADLTQQRHLFLSQIGNSSTTARNIGLIDKTDNIFARGVSASTQYGTIIPIFFTILLLLVFIFALLLVIFSTRIRWIDFKDAASQYECGSEQLHARVTPVTAGSFFRMLVVF